jgi:hypothetical protein
MTDVVMSGDNVVMTPEDPTIAGRVVVTGGAAVVLGLRF